MQVTKATGAMPSPLSASDDGLQLKSSGLTWDPVISMGMTATMATMWMRKRRKKHGKLLMDQRRMWRTDGTVLEGVKIGQYISDLKNTIMAMQMQRHAMHLKRKLHCTELQLFKAKHIRGECGIRYIAIAERYNVTLGRRKALTPPGVV